MRLSILKRAEDRRAVTMVELLVAMSGLLVVLGLALGIGVSSQRTTQHIVRSQAALQYSQMVLDQTMDVLKHAVDPSNLPGLGGQGLQFEADRITLVTAADGGRPGLQLVTLQTVGGGEGQPVSLEKRVVPFGQTSAEPTSRSQQRLGGIVPEHFTPELRFAYAAASHPEQPVEYQERWTGAELPALIRVTVETALEGSEEPPMVLQTAVIPGLLPHSGAALLPDQATSPTLQAAEPIPPTEQVMDQIEASTPVETLAPIAPAETATQTTATTATEVQP